MRKEEASKFLIHWVERAKTLRVAFLARIEKEGEVGAAIAWNADTLVAAEFQARVCKNLLAETEGDDDEAFLKALTNRALGLRERLFRFTVPKSSGHFHNAVEGAEAGAIRDLVEMLEGLVKAMTEVEA
jgi:hypothetical protein